MSVEWAILGAIIFLAFKPAIMAQFQKLKKRALQRMRKQ